MFELLTSLICLDNLQLSKLSDAKFAFFYITEEQMKLLQAELVIAYNLLKQCKVTITLKDNSIIVVKPTRLEKCIGYSAISAKPRLLFYNNPNDITSEVLSVTLTK